MRPLPPKPPRPARGRPRSERARRAVLNAARAILEKQGYQAATVEAIAARSGVAKTTIYRWWPNRGALLVELLMEMGVESVPPPQRGDPLRALRTELRGSVKAINGIIGELMTSLIGEAHHDRDVRASLLNGFMYPRRASTTQAVERAQALGELRPDVPPDLVSDLLFGPLFNRMLIGHEPVTESFVTQMIKFVLEGIGPQRRWGRRTRP